MSLRNFLISSRVRLVMKRRVVCDSSYCKVTLLADPSCNAHCAVWKQRWSGDFETSEPGRTVSVRNTLVGASQRMLVEAGQAGPDGRSHRRLDGRQILGFTQVSQHVLQLTAVRPWNTPQPPHVIGETPAKYSPASTNRSIPPPVLRLDRCFSTLALSTPNTAHVSLFWPVSGAGVSSNELNQVCLIRETHKMCSVGGGGGHWSRCSNVFNTKSQTLLREARLK